MHRTLMVCGLSRSDGFQSAVSTLIDVTTLFPIRDLSFNPGVIIEGKDKTASEKQYQESRR